MVVSSRVDAVDRLVLVSAADPARPPVPVGAWVTAEAPARMDLAGGWTDTPPVCFERAGKVVGVAVRVDEKVSFVLRIPPILLVSVQRPAV